MCGCEINTCTAVVLRTIDSRRGGGWVIVVMHGRSLSDHTPSHPVTAGTEHVGFLQKRQTLLSQARSAMRCSAIRMKGELHPTKNRLGGDREGVLASDWGGGGGGGNRAVRTGIGNERTDRGVPEGGTLQEERRGGFDIFQYG